MIHYIEGENITSVYSTLVSTIAGRGELEGKTRDLLGVQLVLTDPDRSLLLIDKNWKWAFQELFDRMSLALGYPEEYANPGQAYPYRSAWKKKLEKEGGTFDYAYGDMLEHTLPAAIQILRKQKTTREAIIPVWQYDHTTKQKTYNRRPCTLTLHFIIRDGELHCFVNMRTNDVINLLPYDIFHHTFLQKYIAAKLEIPLGHYHHFATHMYYPKKREREGRQFLEKLITKLEKVSIEQHGYKTSILRSHFIDIDMSTAYDILYDDGRVDQAIQSPLIRNMVNYLKETPTTREFPLLSR